MTDRDVLGELVQGRTTPQPPHGMRDRALAAAMAALRRGESRRDVWTRLRSSTVLRLAWATVVIALLIGHLALSLPSQRVPEANQPVLVVAGAEMGSELAELVDLPLVGGAYAPKMDATTIRPQIERRSNHGI
jgi:hypothetical protein